MRAFSSLLLREHFSLSLVLLMLLVLSGDNASGGDTKRPSTSGTASLPQASFQVNNALPPLMLPRLNRSSSKLPLWNSAEQLGQASLLLVLPGSQVKAQNQIAWLRLAQQMAQPIQVQGNGTQIVVITPSALARSVAQKLAQSPFVLLLDGKHRWSQAFKVSSQGAAIVSIDRAGFIRYVERFSIPPTVAALSARLQAANNLGASLEVGKPAPDFTLRDMNGRMRYLSALKGKKHLLLTFFPKCFTGNCTQQVVSLQKAIGELGANETEVWGVSVDPAAGPSGQRAFAAKHGLQFPLIPDVGRSLSILYGAAQSPNQLSARMSVLIDKEGVVRWIDKQMDVKTHGSDVLTKLRQLELR